MPADCGGLSVSNSFHTRNHRLERSASGGRGPSESDVNSVLARHSPFSDDANHQASGMVRLGVSNSGHPPGVRYQAFIRRTGLLAARYLGSRRHTRSRRAQCRCPGAPSRSGRTKPLATFRVASLLIGIPISPEKAGDAPGRCGRLSQPCRTIGRAHRGISLGVVSTQARVPGHRRARLTSGLHFPYRRLILCIAPGARASTIGGGKGLAACAISSRSTHSTLTGASCIAGRT
jgi:hypothetical protein